MLYYLAKLLQATALTIMLIDFLRRFPSLMSREILGLGIILFIIGWLIERVVPRK